MNKATYPYKFIELKFNAKNKNETIQQLHDDKHVQQKLNWPLIYILLSKVYKEIYVGETTNLNSRLSSHLANTKKENFEKAYIILSEYFNKSATLDIESYLIRYLHADEMYTVTNGNFGLADHEYFQNEHYADLFRRVWLKLKEQGIVKHALSSLDNSNFFKYSPYKALNQDQLSATKQILAKISDGQRKTIIVEGGAGTGKSILASFLVKVLVSKENDFKLQDNEVVRNYQKILTKKPSGRELRVGLVIAMADFRQTIKQVFAHTKGLKANMVIGPSEVVKQEYDVLIVDEAHRLRQDKNLGNYVGQFKKNNKKLGFSNSGTELDWVIKQSAIKILFYDKSQTVKPSDVPALKFDKIVREAERNKCKITLETQMRVKGKGYLPYIENLLYSEKKLRGIYHSKEYEFCIYTSLLKMKKALLNKEKQFGLARLVAGYSWEWNSAKDYRKFDIVIDRVRLKWNKQGVKNWAHTKAAKELKEVGCIHTIQGYDLNYTGVIFGKEITYDFERKCIDINKEYYFDRNGKTGIEDPIDLRNYIVNIYRVLMTRGIRGTYIYACDENMRKYLLQHIKQKN